jgi:dipeptidyl aminopeptidase/acylaminoacyl peptidase
MPTKKKRRIDIEDLFKLRVIGTAAMSPDGGRIVFALQRRDLRKNKTFSSLYAVSARGGRLRRLTRGDHADHLPRFSPDGRTLAFLSNRDKTSAVWLLPMDGGEPKRLTDRDGHVMDYSWSPDGKTIAVARKALTEREKLLRDEKTDEAARRPHFRHVTRLVYKFDGEGYLSGEMIHIHLVNVANGRSTRLTDGKWDEVEPRFSPDGSKVSFLSNRVPDPDLYVDNYDIYTVGRDGKGTRRVTRERGPKQSHAWSPDGAHIVFLGHLGGPGEWSAHNCHVRRVKSGGGPSVDLTPDVDRHTMNMVIGDSDSTAFGGPPPHFTADGKRVVFAVTDEGAGHLASVPLEGGPVEPLVDGPVSVFGFGLPATGGPGWAVVADLTTPAEMFSLDPVNGLGKRLSSVNRAALAGIDVAKPEEVRFRRRGGAVHGWLLKPPGFRKGRKYPFVLEIHGGPHCAYGHVFFHEMQLLAARGYVVLMTNPRGSDGYGLDHRTAIHADWGNVDTKDLMRAVDGVVKEGFVDERRMYVTGGSYGGYMTNWLVGHTNRFRAAVTQRSVVNLSSFFGTSDMGYYFRETFDGDPWTNPANYERMSPITYAGKIETPLLIIHSEEDYRCPIGQAEELFVKLKLLGKEVEMVRFVGESHGLSRGGRPQNRVERLKRILGWFKRHGGV